LIFREVEDSDLIARTRRGKIEAYNILVSRWEKRVFNYLLRLVGQREDAMDLSQEVFLKAYQNLGKLADPSRFGPWLFRIAHNEACSHLRRKRPEDELGAETAPAARPPLAPQEHNHARRPAEISEKNCAKARKMV
jgi:RNA polymerase sigma-70 factor (ECF subfamily)